MRFNINKSIIWLLMIIVILGFFWYTGDSSQSYRDPSWDKIELNDDGSIRHCPCPSPEPGPTPTMGNI